MLLMPSAEALHSWNRAEVRHRTSEGCVKVDDTTGWMMGGRLLAPREGRPHMATMKTDVPHIFSVDVEEYFHALALAPAAPRSRWGSLPSRVEQTTDLLLDALDRYGA